MVNYKQSASALILGATVASAYMPVNNNTYEPPKPEYEQAEVYTYTTMMKSYCPEKGLVDKSYTIHQQCGKGYECTQPTGKPYGWEVNTKYCQHGCGAHPTTVVVTECPTATPAMQHPGYWKDTAECGYNGGVTTYTYWYPEPTHYPGKPEHPPTKPECEGPHCKPEYPPTKPEYPPHKPEYPPHKPEHPPTKPEYPPHKPEHPPTKPEYPPHQPEYPPTKPECEGPHCKPEQPPVYPPVQPPVYPPTKPEQPPVYPPQPPVNPPTKPECEGPHCKPEQPPVYPPVQPPVYPPTKPECEGPHCKPETPVYPPTTMTKTPQPPVYTPPTCHGEYCPPTTPECYGDYCPPTNGTVPPPPMYTGGAGALTAASGLVGMVVVAIAALL